MTGYPFTVRFRCYYTVHRPFVEAGTGEKRAQVATRPYMVFGLKKMGV